MKRCSLRSRICRSWLARAADGRARAEIIWRQKSKVPPNNYSGSSLVYQPILITRAMVGDAIARREQQVPAIPNDVLPRGRGELISALSVEPYDHL